MEFSYILNLVDCFENSNQSNTHLVFRLSSQGIYRNSLCMLNVSSLVMLFSVNSFYCPCKLAL